MKNRFVKILTATLCCFLLSLTVAHAQKTTEQVTIKTSGQCKMCKDRIEKAMAYEKGVSKFNYDTVTKAVTVTYNPNKTNPDKIRTAISKIGYDADSVPADPKAYAKLPKCCKKPEAEHEDGCCSGHKH